MSDFVTLWTIACQAPLSMAFPKQENWSELPFPSPGDLPDPEIETPSPGWQAGSLPLNHWGGPIVHIPIVLFQFGTIVYSKVGYNNKASFSVTGIFPKIINWISTKK